VYAHAFAVNLEWLITGRGGPKQAEKVAMVGYVGAGQKIIPIDDHEKGAGLDNIEAPPGVKGSGLCAVKVRGSSMYPAYQDGDVIFYGDRQAPEELIGKEVVVEVIGGEMYVKTLENGSKRGLFTLSSYNAPPLRDSKIIWASRVRFISKH
jgi:phage repressor protein C with HTH and peptisase S24 domain